MTDPLAPLTQRIARLEAEARGVDYPVPERISYIADPGGVRAFFLTGDRYSHGWFYPRYAGGRLHEPVVTRHLIETLTPASVFVDVGAHLGYFAVIAALRARAVFAIEPQEFLIGRIHANVAANHLTNVTILHAAAGPAPGFAPIPKVGSPLTGVGTGENLVPMIRLDDYFQGAHQPTHLKIDTEGFELRVLEGARALLAARPTLYLEVHSGMDRFGGTRTDLWDFLHDHGYALRVGHHRDPAAGFADVPRDRIATLNDHMLLCQPRPGAA
jgi:FkbM family methyltransferase